MKALVRFCKKLASKEEGLETVEYAVIAGLIVVGTIVTVGLIGDQVAATFGALLTALGGVPA